MYTRCTLLAVALVVICGCAKQASIDIPLLPPSYGHHYIDPAEPAYVFVDASGVMLWGDSIVQHGDNMVLHNPRPASLEEQRRIMGKGAAQGQGFDIMLFADRSLPVAAILPILEMAASNGLDHVYAVMQAPTHKTLMEIAFLSSAHTQKIVTVTCGHTFAAVGEQEGHPPDLAELLYKHNSHIAFSDQHIAITPQPDLTFQQLINALSACDRMVGSDQVHLSLPDHLRTDTTVPPAGSPPGKK